MSNNYLANLYHTELKKADQKFRCRWCQVWTTQRESFGQLECLSHPRGFNAMWETYYCCGWKENSKGCTSSDHSATGIFANKFEIIPLVFIDPRSEFKIYKPPVSKDYEASVIRINYEDEEVIKIRICSIDKNI